MAKTSGGAPIRIKVETWSVTLSDTGKLDPKRSRRRPEHDLSATGRSLREAKRNALKTVHDTHGSHYQVYSAQYSADKKHRGQPVLVLYLIPSAAVRNAEAAQRAMP